MTSSLTGRTELVRLNSTLAAWLERVADRTSERGDDLDPYEALADVTAQAAPVFGLPEVDEAHVLAIEAFHDLARRGEVAAFSAVVGVLAASFPHALLHAVEVANRAAGEEVAR